MSSPAHDDAAKQSMPTHPWAEAAAFERERRLHDKITAATELLKQGPRTPFPAERTLLDERVADDVFELAKPREQYFELEEPRRGLWSPSLGPVVMPLPPPDQSRGLGLGTIVMLGGAIGIAAGVAFTVMSALQPPGAGPARSREISAKGPVLSTAALGSLAEIGSAQAKVQPDPAPSAAPSPIIAAAQANTDVAATPSVPVAAPAEPAAAPAATEIKTASVSPEPVAPVAPPAPPPVQARPTVTLAPDEVEQLMRRGRYLLGAGDIASARLILTRLANSGEAEAALLLAGTYDAAELAKARFVGAVPDAAKARAWYEKAAEQGSQEARRRLQQSALR